MKNLSLIADPLPLVLKHWFQLPSKNQPLAPRRRLPTAAHSRVIAQPGAILPGSLRPLATAVRNRPRQCVPPNRIRCPLGLP
jgi:hypothetical protein